ncbi:MAG: YdcH family protein [bacterium]|nr:YdcH family protein [bacterium]
MEDLQVREILSRENAGFEELDKQHRECEQRILELSEGILKTDKEHMEELQLKKQKLRLKDSMQKYISEYKIQVK